MHGMTLPRLLWSLDEANGCWLLLEDIPHRLPRERWGADLEVLSLLWQLHTLPLDASALPPGHYRPGWPEEMTRAALSLFAAATARELRPLLITARQAAEPLFRPLCPLSGDPNPRNWGLREDGQLVLYDWERFCFGSPAIDLAISVPGLGSSDAYRRTAERYLSASHHLVDAAAVAQLTREICIAKVWSVVEFLAHVATGAAQPNFPIDALLDQVPAWLKTELRT
jgi:thiamine kinase-like enzyme